MNIEEIINNTVGLASLTDIQKFKISEVVRTVTESQQKKIEELESGKNTMVFGGRSIGKNYLTNLEKENKELKERNKEFEEIKERIKLAYQVGYMNGGDDFDNTTFETYWERVNKTK